MKKIEQRMQEVLARGEKVLVSGVPIGYPDLETTGRIVETYIRSGIDVVEFSMASPDPYIDTRIIADSNIKALNVEPALDKHLDALREIRRDYPDEPFYMMAYADFIRGVGVKRFVAALQEVGVDALELPDSEEAVPDLVAELDPLLEDAGIYRTYILHHPFDAQYFAHIKSKAHGFFADAQGRRECVSPENRRAIETMRQGGLEVPIILGYGINKPERVGEALALGADGVIVGTAMIERINSGDLTELSTFIREMKAATRPAR
jgi:tryptophan synthase alpha chain